MAGLFDAVMRTDAGGGGVMGVLALPSGLLRAHLFLILNNLALYMFMIIISLHKELWA